MLSGRRRPNLLPVITWVISNRCLRRIHPVVGRVVLAIEARFSTFITYYSDVWYDESHKSRLK
jgi:hypothetical protein